MNNLSAGNPCGTARRLCGRLIVAALLVVFCADITAAAAAPRNISCNQSPECVRLRAEAQRLYEEDKFQMSLSALMSAYVLKADPALLLNMGLTLIGLERAQEALERCQQMAKVAALCEMAPVPEAVKSVVSSWARQAASDNLSSTPAVYAADFKAVLHDGEKPVRTLDLAAFTSEPSRRPRASGSPTRRRTSTPRRARSASRRSYVASRTRRTTTTIRASAQHRRPNRQRTTTITITTTTTTTPMIVD